MTVSSSFSARFFLIPYRIQRAWTVLWSTRHPLVVVRVGAWNSLFKNKCAIPGNPRGLRMTPRVEFLGKNLHIMWKETFRAPADNYENAVLCHMARSISSGSGWNTGCPWWVDYWYSFRYSSVICFGMLSCRRRGTKVWMDINTLWIWLLYLETVLAFCVSHAGGRHIPSLNCI